MEHAPREGVAIAIVDRSGASVESDLLHEEKVWLTESGSGDELK